MLSKKYNTVKKAICMLVSLMIFLNAFSLFAADGPVLSVSSASGCKGDKVNIKISLTQPQGIAGMQFSVKYNKDALSVLPEDIAQGNALNGWIFDKNILKNEGEIKFAFASSSVLQTVNPVDVCSISFTIKSEAQYGEAPVTIESAFAGDGIKNIQVSPGSGKVNILQKTSEATPTARETVTSTPLPSRPPQNSYPEATASPTSAPTAVPVLTPTPPVIAVEPTAQIPLAGVFTDIAGHWAFNYIEDLLERGIIKGYPDGKMRPDDSITRAITILMIVKALGLEPASKVELKFRDTGSIPEWAMGYIQTAVDKGLIKGYEDNTVRAGDRLKRCEMVVIIMKAFGYTGTDGPALKYDDAASIPEWARNFVGAAYEKGIVTGYGDNTFKPYNYITRAEVFTIVSKCLEKTL